MSRTHIEHHLQCLADRGELSAALSYVKTQLELGPGNSELLKWWAELLGAAGQVEAAHHAWLQTLKTHDREAMAYLERDNTEQREVFFFSEATPGGGVRILAAPRRLFRASLLGLLSSSLFLTLSTFLSFLPPQVAVPLGTLGFILGVITPWSAIVWAYLTELRELVIEAGGVRAEYRLRREVMVSGQAPYLAWNTTDTLPCLELCLPTSAHTITRISLSAHDSPLRGRRVVLDLLTQQFGPLHIRSSVA